MSVSKHCNEAFEVSMVLKRLWYICCPTAQPKQSLYAVISTPPQSRVTIVRASKAWAHVRVCPLPPNVWACSLRTPNSRVAKFEATGSCS